MVFTDDMKVKIPPTKYVLDRIKDDNIYGFSNRISRGAYGYRNLLLRVRELVKLGCTFTLEYEILKVKKAGTSFNAVMDMTTYPRYIINTIVDIIYPVLE